MSKQQKSSKPADKTAPAKTAPERSLVFGRNNYLLMLGAVVVIILGFMLMYGDDQDIYSTRRITVAPVTVLLGFVIGIVAIMYKPKVRP